MSIYLLDSHFVFSEDTALCLGTFDGVHLGHQALIARTVALGRENGWVPAAFTFDVPPAAAIHPERAVELLTPLSEKAALLTEYGLTHVFHRPFDSAVARMSAEDFFQDILVHRLRARALVIGFHYRFGWQAKGDAKLMARLCRQAGIRLDVIAPVCMPDHRLISSTAIRQALSDGRADEAQAMLGRTLSPRENELLGGIRHDCHDP